MKRAKVYSIHSPKYTWHCLVLATVLININYLLKSWFKLNRIYMSNVV